MKDEPHPIRSNGLKNGNPSGDLATVRRCGARARGGVLQTASNAERSLPDAWGQEHRAAHPGRAGTVTTGELEARELLSGGNGAAPRGRSSSALSAGYRAHVLSCAVTANRLPMRFRISFTAAP
jgi:hypothetical protein